MLPIVMRSNLVKSSLELEERFPKRLGLLFASDGLRKPRDLPYALDNGRFSVWSKGKVWDHYAYIAFLKKVQSFEYPPIWAVVPDVVGNAQSTCASWKKWAGWMQYKFGWDLAIAVQDGMTAENVYSLSPQPKVIFVGGTTKWKWRSLKYWTKHFPRVHVGRVNTVGLLWRVHRAGAESSDGTRWFQLHQAKQLVRYLDRSSRGLGETDIPGLLW